MTSNFNEAIRLSRFEALAFLQQEPSFAFAYCFEAAGSLVLEHFWSCGILAFLMFQLGAFSTEQEGSSSEHFDGAGVFQLGVFWELAFADYKK
jgi:hypothetical protein